MTRQDIQDQIDRGETLIELPAGQVRLDQPVQTKGKPVRFVGRGQDQTGLQVDTVGFLSDSQSLIFQDLWMRGSDPFKSIAANLRGTGVGADIEAHGCKFDGLLDALSGDWLGGFIRVSDCRFTNINRSAIFGRSNGGYWISQILGNYFDGRESPALIQLEGAHVGGIIANNWMQASRCHIAINVAAVGPMDELVISTNLLDQDSDCTAAITVNGPNADSAAMHWSGVRIRGNEISTKGCGVLAASPCRLIVQSNSIRSSGGNEGVRLSGVRSRSVDISNNDITFVGPTGQAAIGLYSPESAGITVAGNKGDSVSGQVPAFVHLGGAATGIRITGNTPGAGYSRLITSTATGEGSSICGGNYPINQPYLGVVAAAVTELPFADDGQIVGITASGIPITKLTGLSARAGVRRTLIAGGRVDFVATDNTDNTIGKGFVLSAGEIAVITKFQDNLWYRI